MNTNPVEAKVKKSGGSSTGLLIKGGNLVIQTEFGELVACEFPVQASSPVHVEIPPSGTKSFVVGGFSGSMPRQPAEGDYPHTIKFPIYKGQDVATEQSYRQVSSDGNGQALTKMPIVALATGVRGVVDGKIVQTHCVLPIWNDGSAVLVRLDWFEGEPSEGTPNPEWHMSASTGLPAALGLEQLERVSQLPTNAEHCSYQLQLTPWLLGAQLLEDKGKETAHRVWQREWQFQSVKEFSSALNRITGSLLGPEPSSHRNAA